DPVLPIVDLVPGLAGLAGLVGGLPLGLGFGVALGGLGHHLVVSFLAGERDRLALLAQLLALLVQLLATLAVLLAELRELGVELGLLLVGQLVERVLALLDLGRELLAAHALGDLQLDPLTEGLALALGLDLLGLLGNHLGHVAGGHGCLFGGIECLVEIGLLDA